MGNCLCKCHINPHQQRSKKDTAKEIKTPKNEIKRSSLSSIFRRSKRDDKYKVGGENPRFSKSASTSTTNSNPIRHSKNLIQPRRDVELNSSTITNESALQALQLNSSAHETSETHRVVSRKKIDETKIKNLFDKYKDAANENLILSAGVQKFCDDLNLKPDEYKVLLLAWKLGAKTTCKFSRNEFMDGMKNMGVDNLSDLLKELDNLQELLQHDANEFRNLYRWTFDFGLDLDAGERTLPLEIAILLWELVYEKQRIPILANWLEFLRDNPQIKGIPRDTWYMFPQFACNVGELNFDVYDHNEAWPCLFDDFVQSEMNSKEILRTAECNN